MTVCCQDKLKARNDILRKYLQNVPLEIEALFALQQIYVKYNEPVGTFKTLLLSLLLSKYISTISSSLRISNTNTSLELV